MEQEKNSVQTEDFASMLEESFQENGNNKVCDGTIVKIEGDYVYVAVGEKLEGRLRIEEIKDKDGNLKYNLNDKIPVLKKKSIKSERPVISHINAVNIKAVKEFIEKHQNDYKEIVLEGTITHSIKNGYMVSVNNASFFLPSSQISTRKDNEPIGKKMKFKILKLDKDKNSVIISRKKYKKDEKKKIKDIIKRIMQDDVVVDGTVKKITNYGMFVDIGDLDGLVHYDEISYKGPVNPSKLYNVGDKVTVKAISYDNKKHHLSLSIKKVSPDPWEEIENELEVGDVIKVTISNIEPYGAFVDLGNDIEGFLHISEISWDKTIKHPKDIINIGDEIDVEVIELDCQNKKLRVSYKKLQPKPFEEFFNKYKEGDTVKGKITTITDFGAFIKIDKIEGLLHNENASWDKNAKCKNLFKVNDKIEVKIVSINKENEKVSLSKKELEDSPTEEFAKKYKVGDIVKGRIKNIKEFGIFVELTKGIDALIRIDDIYPFKLEDLKVDQEIEAMISLIDTKYNRVRLSVKRLEKKREKEALKKINSGSSISLGNTLGEALKEIR